MCIKLLQTYTKYNIININRFRHEPNTIVNSFVGMIGSKSLNETD